MVGHDCKRGTSFIRGGWTSLWGGVQQRTSFDPPPSMKVLALGGPDPPPSMKVLALGGLQTPSHTMASHTMASRAMASYEWNGSPRGRGTPDPERCSTVSM